MVPPQQRLLSENLQNEDLNFMTKDVENWRVKLVVVG